MRLLAILTLAVLTSLGVLAVFNLRGNQQVPVATEKTSPEPVPSSAAGSIETPRTSTIKRVETTEISQARPIAPGIVAPPAVTGPLEREEPRAALSSIGPANPPVEVATKAGRRKAQLLHVPLVTGVATLEAGGHVVELEGVKTPDPSLRCMDSDGTEQPCGMMARSAVRQWVRSRAVICAVPDQPSDVEIKTWCSLAGKDMGLWLAENGWLLEADTPELNSALEKARQQRLGIYAFSGISRTD